MATTEGFVLAGLNLNDGTSYTLEALSVPPAKKRPEWVAGGDSDGAVLGREALYENRVVSVRVRVEPRATMDLALAAVGALTDKLQEAEKGGVDAVWTPADSTKALTLKVLLGEVDSLPVVVDGGDAGWFVKAPVVEFTLTCRPGMRGTEVAGTPASSTAPLMTVELTGVAGDLPADARVIVTDAATQSRRHVEIGLESRYYPTTSPPSLILDSDGLVVSGFAGQQAVATRTGAYDPDAAGTQVVKATLATQPLAVCGTGVRSHVGAFRVKARVYGVLASTTSSIYVRLAWQDGDGPWRANSYVQLPVVSQFVEIDLGTIRLDPVTLGTQRWQGRIEAYSAVVDDSLEVDYLLLMPATEGYAVIRGEYMYAPGVLVARDEFTSIASGTVLNARALPVGGSWVTSGATTDFTAADAPLSTDETMSRATTDSTYRYAIAGATNYTDIEVSARVRASSYAQLPRSAVIARWTDSANYLRAEMLPTGVTVGDHVLEIQQLAAVGGNIRVGYAPKINLAPNTWYTLRLIVYASGQAIAMLLDATGVVLVQAKGQSSTLATGGSLATGKPGFSDYSGPSGTSTRYYDNFYAATPAAEPIVLYSGRSLEARSDTALRQDSTGTYYGPPPSYRGSRFTIPPAGAGARKARVAVKARRNDIAVAADEPIADNLTVQVNHTPVYLVAPR